MLPVWAACWNLSASADSCLPRSPPACFAASESFDAISPSTCLAFAGSDCWSVCSWLTSWPYFESFVPPPSPSPSGSTRDGVAELGAETVVVGMMEETFEMVILPS